LNLPKHIGVIMDGNGRWAKARSRERIYGHIKGAGAAINLIENCTTLGIQYLTLYAFSTENWLRPLEEVSFLMSLLKKHLAKERKKLMANNIRFRYIGELHRLPTAVADLVRETVEESKNNTGMQLIFALSYGGRQEITKGAKALALKVKNGEINPNDIDEQLFSEHLETAEFPDPDLIIRTSGESRLSNFMLWQSAYSEIYFCDTFWPEFGKQHLDDAVRFFASRERRFGKTAEQITPPVANNNEEPTVTQ